MGGHVLWVRGMFERVGGRRLLDHRLRVRSACRHHLSRRCRFVHSMFRRRARLSGRGWDLLNRHRSRVDGGDCGLSWLRRRVGMRMVLDEVEAEP